MTAVTASSISVAWSGWRGRGAAYRVFRDGVPVDWTSNDGYTFTGLSCERSYVLGVAAFRAHRRLPVAADAIVARTAACPVPPDTAAPSSPGNVHVAATTADSITIAWEASKDDVGVAGYGIYNGVTRIDSTTATSYTFAKLDCATGYTLAVDAYDAAGNQSATAGVGARTDNCQPPPDTEAPTVPGNLHATVTTASSITIVWDPSTDNVAVVGYGVYNGVTRFDTTSATSYTFEKLSCGAGHTLAVDAYDAAGNRSGTAALDAKTEPCPIAEPPPIAGQGYRLVFGDEFNSLDRSVWDDHIWYDDKPDPAWSTYQTVHDGELDLTSSRNFFWGTARIHLQLADQHRHDPVVGEDVPVRLLRSPAEVDGAKGSWPAFWLHSTSWTTTDQCAHQAGEIDVMEGQGVEPSVFYGTVHSNTNGAPSDDQNGNNWQPVGTDLTTDFHTYGALWTSTR